MSLLTWIWVNDSSFNACINDYELIKSITIIALTSVLINVSMKAARIYKKPVSADVLCNSVETLACAHGQSEPQQWYVHHWPCGFSQGFGTEISEM